MLVDTLVKAGVKYVFGIPGHTCLGIVEALRTNPEIEFITVRHEETAALMASAYAKLTDKLGVCLTIAGPGATNLMTGLYDAKMDRAPVLAITGQVEQRFIGRDMLQEIDQHSLFASVSLYNKVISTSGETAEITLLAIKNALVHRGVSHLGIPVDLQKAKTYHQAKSLDGRLPAPRIRPPSSLCKQAAKIIDAAKRPMIIVGWGARHAKDQFTTFAEKIGAPIVTTFKAKGLVSEFHPQSAGVLGYVGWGSARELAKAADTLIVLGSSSSILTGIPQNKTLLQIDLDPLMIGKHFPVTLGLWGSVQDTLPELSKRVRKRDNTPTLNKIQSVKAQYLKKIEEQTSSDAVPIHPARVLKALQKVLPKDAIVTIDVGDNSFWFGKYFQSAGQRLLFSGYLFTMGFGFAGALAAAFAEPQRKVVALSGDGAFAQLMGDFTTAVKYNKPLVVLVYNNSEYSLITHEQKQEGYPPDSTSLLNPSFADFAVSCGGLGYTVRHPDELESSIQEALDSGKPAVVDIFTDPKKFWMDRPQKL